MAAASRPAARSSLAMLLDQVAGDDLALHFRCAFVNPQGADFAVELLDLGALGDAEAAMHLHGRVDDLLGFFGGVKLGHGGGAAVVGDTPVLLPGGAGN